MAVLESKRPLTVIVAGRKSYS